MLSSVDITVLADKLLDRRFFFMRRDNIPAARTSNRWVLIQLAISAVRRVICRAVPSIRTERPEQKRATGIRQKRFAIP